MLHNLCKVSPAYCMLQITQEDLVPKMMIQSKERMSLRDFEALNARLVGLKKFCIAYEFTSCER